MSKKLCIIEGVDLVGKSTLIKKLESDLKYSFTFHTSAPPKIKNQKEYYKKILYKMINLIKELENNVIIDRFHIGEKVYGKICRNYKTDIDDIDKELEKLNAKLIYITCNLKELKRRYKNRGDWHIKEEQLEKLKKEYEEEIKNTNLPVFILDTTNGIKEEDYKKILEFLNKNKKQTMMKI